MTAMQDRRTQEVINDEHLRGEETAWEKANRDAQEGEPITLEQQSYDPRQDKPRAEKLKPKQEYDADDMLQRWWIHRTTGKLDKVLVASFAEQGAAGDEGEAIALYVESTKPFVEAMDRLRPVLFHKLSGDPWATWYEPFSRGLAAAMYDGFRDRLTQRLKDEPFTFDGTRVSAPDHIAEADRASEELRNFRRAA